MGCVITNLSSVGIFHNKAQSVMCLEGIFQGLGDRADDEQSDKVSCM